MEFRFAGGHGRAVAGGLMGRVIEGEGAGTKTGAVSRRGLVGLRWLVNT